MTTMLQTYCKNIEGKGLVTTSIFQGKELRFY
jgi:hypothetical protein